REVGRGMSFPPVKVAFVKAITINHQPTQDGIKFLNCKLHVPAQPGQPGAGPSRANVQHINMVFPRASQETREALHARHDASLTVVESNGLDSMRIYLHNKGAFDRIESNHHTSTAAFPQEDPFHAAKYSGADDYALAHLKIGMGCGVAMLNSFFDPVNLVFRN